MDDAELAKLLAAASLRRWRDHLLFVLLVTTCMRPGEALALTRGDLTLTDRSPAIRVRRLKKRADQGAIDDLPISRSLGRALLRRFGRLAPEARIFPMTVRNAEILFKRYAQRAGLRAELRLYSLRHTGATRLWRETLDLRLLQEQLGHASPITTQIYTHVEPEARRRAAERVAVA